MRRFFTSRTVAVLILVVLLCVGSILYTGVTGNRTPLTAVLGAVATPLQNGVSSVANMVNGGVSYFTEFDNLKKENEELQKRVRELEQTVRDGEQALDENGRLRNLLGIRERRRDFTFEPAEVIARSVGDWTNILTLDCGTLDDVAEGNLVITQDGMVGYVSMAAANYCEVTSVLDADMQAGALISRTREVAIAEGDYSLMSKGVLRLSYLKKDADIVIGDTVETSGRGGLFPKGMMIGTIEQIIPEEHGISNYAIVKPYVDVSSVKHVFVIKDFEVVD